MPKPLDLLTIGDCAIDLFMKIPDNVGMEEDVINSELPRVCFFHGSKIAVESFQTSIAGNSVNAAVGAKLLGLNVGVYTETGDDPNADRIINELFNLGIDVDYCVKNRKTETDIHTIIVFAGERTIFSYHGKRKYEVRGWPKPRMVYYTSIGSNFEEFQEELSNYIKDNKDVSLAFNPGTMHIKKFREKGVACLSNILSVTDILIVNKEEAELLTGEKAGCSVDSLHKKLALLGPKLTAITEAESGASAFDGNKLLIQPAYTDQRPIADKTGAGDAFSAGFISAILQGKALDEALKWGTVDAGCQIKVVGATEGLVSKKEMAEIMKGLN